MRASTCFIIVACVAMMTSSGFAADSQHVTKLTANTYDEAINDGKVWYVKFFAPWCGHCQQLAPTWDELAADLASNDKVKIAHVDCTTDDEVCGRVEVEGYPTLMAFHNGEKLEEYNGSRDKKWMKKWILEKAEAVGL